MEKSAHFLSEFIPLHFLSFPAHVIVSSVSHTVGFFMSLVFYVCCLMGLRMLCNFAFMPLVGKLDLPSPGTLIGAYGLGQAIFQYPLAFVSDWIGRKRVIVLCLMGLICFSLVAWLVSPYPTLLITARFLQGSCALGATALAMVADTYQGTEFQKTLYWIGLSIFASYVLSFPLAMLLEHLAQPLWIFPLSALVAVVLLILTQRFEEPSSHHEKPNFSWDYWSYPVIVVSAYSFVVHALQTFTFATWALYKSEGSVKSLAISFFMACLICGYSLAKRLQTLSLKQVIVVSLIAFLSSFCIVNWMFFTTATFILLLLLEPTLPALLSTVAPSQQRGHSMGLYSTSQYLGMFVGGLLCDRTHSVHQAFLGHAVFYGLSVGCGYLLLRLLQASSEQKAG